MARGPVGEEYFENWHADAMAVLGDFDPRLGNRLGLQDDSQLPLSFFTDYDPLNRDIFTVFDRDFQGHPPASGQYPD